MNFKGTAQFIVQNFAITLDVNINQDWDSMIWFSKTGATVTMGFLERHLLWWMRIKAWLSSPCNVCLCQKRFGVFKHELHSRIHCGNEWNKNERTDKFRDWLLQIGTFCFTNESNWKWRYFYYSWVKINKMVRVCWCSKLVRHSMDAGKKIGSLHDPTQFESCKLMQMKQVYGSTHKVAMGVFLVFLIVEAHRIAHFGFIVWVYKSENHRNYRHTKRGLNTYIWLLCCCCCRCFVVCTFVGVVERKPYLLIKF